MNETHPDSGASVGKNVCCNVIAMGNAMLTVLTVLRKASRIYVEEIRIIIRIPVLILLLQTLNHENH